LVRRRSIPPYSPDAVEKEGSTSYGSLEKFR
jgi:hypothetical protein